MQDLGLVDVALEPLPVDAWRLEDAFVQLADGTRFECASFGGVPGTGKGGVEGELIRVGRGGRRRLDRLDVAGKVALVDWDLERLWPCHVGLELGLRGAVAMVVTSPTGGPYYQAPGALGAFDGQWPTEAPTCVTIRKEDAPRLDGRVRVVLDATLRPGEAANVVGVLPGRRGGAPAIVAGHHDGWFRAAFDDATGVAVTLGLARAFCDARVRPERPIVFVSHTAEEYGIADSPYDWCYGAWWQVVEDHREWSTDASFYLNVEGSGRPETFTVDAPPELARWASRVCRRAARDGLLPHGFAIGKPSTWTEVWPFLAAGIPGLNVSTFTSKFDRTEYHTQFDTVERVDFGYLAKLTRVCADLLLEGPAEPLDYAARARELRAVLPDAALTDLVSASGRPRFTAVGRGLHGLDARETAAYPHEQTARDVANLERALDGDSRALARVGLNWLCAYLGPEAFAIERSRRGRDAPRACWAAQGDPDIGPDLWQELASSRGEPGARPPGPWLEENLRGHLDASKQELERRLARMAAAARGEVLPLPSVPRENRPR
jgi:Iap family predicted aminopeptidase